MTIPFLYHMLMTCYGWTIDYINDNVTLAQIMILTDEIVQNPPATIISYGLGNKKVDEDKLLGQIDSLGSDKVKYEKYYKKDSIKSVIRLRDKAKIK